MNIVFVTHRYWPDVGGVEKYLHRLSQALQRMGHHVCVVAGAHQDGLPTAEVHEGITIRRFPAYRSPVRAWWHMMRMRPVFQDADIIHVSDTYVLEYFYRMVAWTIPRKPLFLTRHGMSYVCPVPEREKSRARRSLDLVDGIIHDGCFIEPWLGVAPDCVPNQGLYPEADDIPDVPEPSPMSATFVGRLEPDSGIRIYVDAIRVLKHTHNLSMTLNVYGDGTLLDQLRKQAHNEHLPIQFHGWHADAQERMTDGCFAFVAGRMAMQEAMARKRMVIAAYVDPLKKDYVNGEPFSPYVVSGGDAKTIASHLAHYATQVEPRHQLIDRAYNYARTLSWQRTATEYVNLWTQAPRRSIRKKSLSHRIALAWQFAVEAQRPAWT